MPVAIRSQRAFCLIAGFFREGEMSLREVAQETARSFMNRVNDLRRRNLFIPRLVNAISIEREDLGIRIAEQEGRMARNDERRVLVIF